jgi:hypothetical protein
MLFSWWRSRSEALDLAKTLEAENEQLRDRVDRLGEMYGRALALVRALRDVNADLDRKLLEATHGQG